jgi:putative MATE family efflux protein
MFSVVVSLLFFITSICFPNALMRVFTNDAELIAYGVNYQRAVSFSYLAMSLSQIYLGVARSMEKARFSAIVSSGCLLLNIVLNAVSIFLLFPGQPDKAVAGVAAATVTARCIELICCVIHSTNRSNIRFSLPVRDNMQKQLMRDFLRYTTPVQANYIVWGCATAATAAIIGHVSPDMVAANSIAGVVKNLAVILCDGIATGGSILVGKSLGSGDIGGAKKAGIRLCVYALLFGVLAGASILVLKPLIFRVVSLNDTAQSYLNGMLYVCAYYCVGKSLNSTVIGGIFPAGGDSKFGFWCDTVVMWGVILPLGFLCAFVWRVAPMFLYIVICLDEFVKLPAAIFRFRQYRWLNNITREFFT